MRTMASRADDPPLKSLDMALRVLEALDNGAPERGVSDLARELGVSKAAVYRILSTLALRGYVTQNPATAQYAIGPRLRRYSHVATGKLDLQTVARPFMTELRDATLDTVHLAVLEGGEAVYIAKEDGLHPVRNVSRRSSLSRALRRYRQALLAYADATVPGAASLWRTHPLHAVDARRAR